MRTFSKQLAVVIIISLTVWGEDKGTLPLPSSGNVTLTLAEYNRLTDLADKAAKKHETPPVAYAIKHADLKLKVGSESVTGTVMEEGEVFSKGAAKVPLTTGMTVFNAHQQGKTLPLLQDGSFTTAVLPGAAEFAITLDAGLPLGIEAGRASFNLPVPAAGSVRMMLVIPGEHTNVRLNPGLITARSSESGQTTIEATLSPGQQATVWWTTREIAAPVVPKEVRFLSDVKTLVSVGEADLRIAALADITVIQGEPTQFTVAIPVGYEVTGATGATVESAEAISGTLTLKLSSGAQRNHQFLISIERALTDPKAEVPFLSFKDTQRETGEVLIEGAGAMELTAKEAGGLKRMDLKEVNPYLRSLSRFPLQAAFRFHRQPGEVPALALDWVRFPDSSVLAALAERAVVTTMVTSEGRSLTEVKLTVKNQAQPFLKVDLPAGATILSADVAGEKVKPVQGPDGNRVPLLRAGFRPTNAYEVSFVFLHSGSPFAKKGGSEISLPSMDVPISVLEWEVYLPEQYKVKDFGGDAIAMNLFPDAYSRRLEDLALIAPGIAANSPAPAKAPWPLMAGQIGGVVTDPQGAVIANAAVKVTSTVNGVTQTTTTDNEGRWAVSGMPSGNVKVQVSSPGFKTSVANFKHDAANLTEKDARLDVGAATSTVEVTAASPQIDTSMATVRSGSNQWRGSAREEKKEASLQQAASDNVFNLQKKVAGVLPVRVDVPRAGSSYRFARALVLDEETRLTFSYKTK